MSITSAPPTSAAPIKRVSFDRAIRKVFPSTSRLTFNPLFKAVVNAFDVLPRMLYSELRGLPPNHLRIRIGVGNRILNNQFHFLAHARDFWMFAFSEGLANTNATIVDIGSGCGRWAHWLRDYNFRGRTFTGKYIGVDIDAEAIAWCEKHYDPAHFRFHRSTDASVSYNQQGQTKTHYRVPEPDGTVDLVFSNSLLTHVLDAELENYVRESYRLLKDGGAMFHSHFNLDHPPATYGGRHTFRHAMGNARVESLEQPEAAVAYRTDYLFRVAREAGFKTCEIVYIADGSQHQPMLLCKK
jgi:SAM-dependent methyltransferase